MYSRLANESRLKRVCHSKERVPYTCSASRIYRGLDALVVMVLVVVVVEEFNDVTASLKRIDVRYETTGNTQTHENIDQYALY